MWDDLTKPVITGPPKSLRSVAHQFNGTITFSVIEKHFIYFELKFSGNLFDYGSELKDNNYTMDLTLLNEYGMGTYTLTFYVLDAGGNEATYEITVYIESTPYTPRPPWTPPTSSKNTKNGFLSFNPISMMLILTIPIMVWLRKRQNK